MDINEVGSLDYIEGQYELWKSDPTSVSRDWHYFFKGFEMALVDGLGALSADDAATMSKQSQVDALVHRYRDVGHLLACLDPLVACPTDHPLLTLSAFDLAPEDLNRSFFSPSVDKRRQTPLKDTLKDLRETYCRSVGVEYMHMQDPDERRWLQERMEPTQNRPHLEPEQRCRIWQQMFQTSLFEQFLHKKYIGQTRFSIEGAEALIPMMDELCSRAGEAGCREVILGMAHRGRLSVQTGLLKKSFGEIFCEFENNYNPDSLVGAGDVKYHNGYLADIETTEGRPLRLFLVNNPSHLESVNPVVQGIARARQDQLGRNATHAVMPLLIHGDAAFAGQGVVAETLNMSQLNGYRTGGTIHIVINNQIGYTTLPEDARSTRYSTDVAKMLMVPIFHVHGENPEALIQVARLASAYRMTFGKDVVIDLVCYRRFGHNEGDEPYFTQPQMYARIRERPPVHQLYSQRLVEENHLSPEQIERTQTAFTQELEQAFKEAKDETCIYPGSRHYEVWQKYHGRYSHEGLETGLPRRRLVELAQGLSRLPQDFTPHPKLKSLLQRRLEAVEKGEGIDWANAEALAFASLLTEGAPIRLSGQDSGRGTFSQRHAVMVDARTGERHLPLNSLAPQQAMFEVYDSMLSEVGILGFEYGYSLMMPQGLVLWEAQFGDFANNAQAVIDLYIASGETKWHRLSGLVLLLPHGWEGLGPEHSSARLERFLQLCADDNLQVCNLSTPAQYFHALRRQVKAPFRKPLIIMTPKSLLRHPLAVSRVDALAHGSFQAVLDDPEPPAAPKKILLCSGKIYYQLIQRRRELEVIDIGILRLEQFYPWPEDQLEQIATKYKKAKQWVWVQEEPENMGAWRFVRPRLEQLLRRPLQYIGRQPAASPATGFLNIYRQDQEALAAQAVGPKPSAGRALSS